MTPHDQISVAAPLYSTPYTSAMDHVRKRGERGRSKLKENKYPQRRSPDWHNEDSRNSSATIVQVVGELLIRSLRL